MYSPIKTDRLVVQMPNTHTHTQCTNETLIRINQIAIKARRSADSHRTTDWEDTRTALLPHKLRAR